MTISHLHSPGELLAAIPQLLGFTPRDSIVVIGVRRSHHLGLIMRLDRADCFIPEVARELGQAVGAHLERDGVGYALLVTFLDDLPDGECEALAALRPWIDDYVPVREEWLVGDGRYRSASCGDVACCPPRGVPLPPTPRLPESAGVSASWQPQVERTHHIPDIPADQRRRASRARDRAWAARDRDPQKWRGDMLALWRESVTAALDGRFPSDAQCGRLIAGLQDVRVRDAVIVDLDREYSEEADQVIAGANPDRVRDALLGLLAEPENMPDAARVEAASDVAMRLAGCAWGRRDASLAAPSLTIAAVAGWWRGESTVARRLVLKAIEADPDYYLARLVDATFASGLAPRRHQAWGSGE